MSRPNILLIITDQQRADHTGFGGSDIVRTPNIDALAARGRVFDQAFVANPICMPNRCSMLTGRVPSAHDVIFNDRSLAWSANTFVRQLAASGYRTGLIGKSHIQHGTSRDSVVPLRRQPAVADPYPEGWNTVENYERYIDSAEPVTNFYGFQHAEFTLGHGDLVTGHHYRWALDKGANPEELLLEWPDSSWPARQRSEHWWQVYQPNLDEEYYSTTFVRERTCDWLSDQSADNPWFLQCSFPDPHHPFTPPGKWWDAYQASDMPLPATINDPLDGAPEHLRYFRGLEPREYITQMFGATRGIVRDAMAAEFGMIEFIDESIGRIMSTLEQQSMIDNTIVIFTSDHGDMFGDHGLMMKAMMHYDGCIRVPFIVAAPEIKPGRSDSLICSMDIAQTVLELTGGEPFDRMQGVSFTPLLDDPAATVRDHVYIEEDMPLVEAVGRVPHRARTLVTHENRITAYSSNEVEVYDRVNDPDELTNLCVSEPGSSQVAEMKQRLIESMMQYSDFSRVNVA
jgi:arylsulfatase A-like enzyme